MVSNLESLRWAVDNYAGSRELFLAALNSQTELAVWYGIKGCGLMRITESIPQLIGIIGKPCNDLGGTDLRRIAVWSLARIGYSKWSHQVETLLHEENPLIREGLADLLGLVGEPEVLRSLAVLVDDADSSVAMWAALSLSKYGDLALGILQGSLNTACTTDRKMYILDSLNKVATNAASSIIRAYYSRPISEDVRAFHKYYTA